MSDFDFVAWTLAVGGIAAISIFAISKIVAWAMGKPPYSPKPAELASAIALSLALGGVLTRLLAHSVLQVEPPQWSALSFGVMVLIQGASSLVTGQRDATGYSSARTLSWFLLGMGILILAVTLFDLLVMKGTGL